MLSINRATCIDKKMKGQVSENSGGGYLSLMEWDGVHDQLSMSSLLVRLTGYYNIDQKIVGKVIIMLSNETLQRQAIEIILRSLFVLAVYVNF